MITFLGTGLLGANFTRALLNRGEKVNVWNRSEEKARALEQYGAKAFNKASEAVRGASRIHVTLSDDQSVDEVLGEASKGFESNVIIVDHTTTSAPGAAKRVAYWKEKGYNYVHAPVFMGPPNALESTGTMLISGNQQLIQQIEPELSKMTGKLWNLGEQPDKAAAIKLLGNLFHISITGGVADMLTLAGTLNIDPADLGPLLELLNPSAIAQARLRKITSNTFDKASWELSMSRKDARLMIEQAASANKKLPVISAVAIKMDEYLEKGYAKKDWTIIGS